MCSFAVGIINLEEIKFSFQPITSLSGYLVWTN
jgi:hypothetical protein